MTNKLKPCPFCGGEGTFSTSELPGLSSDMSFYIVCDTCECSTSYEDTGNDAIKKWNTRQPAFDWKPIEELTEAIIQQNDQILFLHKDYEKYVLADTGYDDFGGTFIVTGDFENNEYMHQIERNYTHYVILTPPQTNINNILSWEDLKKYQ